MPNSGQNRRPPTREEKKNSITKTKMATRRMRLCVMEKGGKTVWCHGVVRSRRREKILRKHLLLSFAIDYGMFCFWSSHCTI
jgi:hypothetical protein